MSTTQHTGHYNLPTFGDVLEVCFVEAYFVGIDVSE